MTHRTRRSHPQLLPPVEGPERMGEENTLDREDCMRQLLEAASSQRNPDLVSLEEQQRASEPVAEDPVKQVEVLEMIEDAVKQLTNKLEARRARVTKDTLAKFLETPKTN